MVFTMAFFYAKHLFKACDYKMIWILFQFVTLKHGFQARFRIFSNRGPTTSY